MKSTNEQIKQRNIRASVGFKQNESARTAGYTLSQALTAGYTLSQALTAGYTLSQALAAGYKEKDFKEWDSIPVLDKPYTQLLKDIADKKRCYNQETFGEIEDFNPELNVCGTAMCIAGHLVNMCGKEGYKFMKKYGWVVAAELIHNKNHPTFPCPNFGLTNQENGLACIEVLAEMEENEKLKNN